LRSKGVWHLIRLHFGGDPRRSLRLLGMTDKQHLKKPQISTIYPINTISYQIFVNLPNHLPKGLYQAQSLGKKGDTMGDNSPKEKEKKKRQQQEKEAQDKARRAQQEQQRLAQENNPNAHNPNIKKAS